MEAQLRNKISSARRGSMLIINAMNILYPYIDQTLDKLCAGGQLSNVN